MCICIFHVNVNVYVCVYMSVYTCTCARICICIAYVSVYPEIYNSHMFPSVRCSLVFLWLQAHLFASPDRAIRFRLPGALRATTVDDKSRITLYIDLIYHKYMNSVVYIHMYIRLCRISLINRRSLGRVLKGPQEGALRGRYYSRSTYVVRPGSGHQQYV